MSGFAIEQRTTRVAVAVGGLSFGIAAGLIVGAGWFFVVLAGAAGLGLGLMAVAVPSARPKGPPVLQTHRVVCFTASSVAECTFEREGDEGRFCDVKSCSLFGQERSVRCDKACLGLMNSPHD